uniref:(northern house mosquito) hypothetical protein n=1 Tax=Culex pipiens TaxID=7175 RepID=A0A8D8I349_CULPI
MCKCVAYVTNLTNKNSWNIAELNYGAASSQKNSESNKLESGNLTHKHPIEHERGHSSNRIEILLKIPDPEMARAILYKTINLLQETANKTEDLAEKDQALHCIALIKRDNASLMK